MSVLKPTISQASRPTRNAVGAEVSQAARLGFKPTGLLSKQEPKYAPKQTGDQRDAEQAQVENAGDDSSQAAQESSFAHRMELANKGLFKKNKKNKYQKPGLKSSKGSRRKPEASGLDSGNSNAWGGHGGRGFGSKGSAGKSNKSQKNSGGLLGLSRSKQTLRQGIANQQIKGHIHVKGKTIPLFTQNSQLDFKNDLRGATKAITNAVLGSDATVNLKLSGGENLDAMKTMVQFGMKLEGITENQVEISYNDLGNGETMISITRDPEYSVQDFIDSGGAEFDPGSYFNQEEV